MIMTNVSFWPISQSSFFLFFFFFAILSSGNLWSALLNTIYLTLIHMKYTPASLQATFSSWCNITGKSETDYFPFQIEPFNYKVAMWNQIANSLLKKSATVTSKDGSSQFSSCFPLCCVTAILWWHVISKPFTPHCLLMVLLVCGCPSWDVFAGTTFNFPCLTT